MSKTDKNTIPNAEFADFPVTFEVTLEDAKGSVVADPERCAGACALKKMTITLPNGKHRRVRRAIVKRSRTWLQFFDGTALKWENPKALKRAVENFDFTGGFFPPGTYKLKPLCQAQRETYSGRKGNRDGSRPHQSRNRPVHTIR